MNEDEAGCTSEPSPRSRKHARDSTVNGLSLDLTSSQAPAAKRSRRIHGVETTNGDPSKKSDAMDLDHNGYSHTSAMLSTDGPHQASDAEGDMDVDSDSAGGTAPDGTLIAGTNAKAADADAHDPTLQEQPTAIVATLTNGRSVGVQSDKGAAKATELGSDSRVLTLPLPGTNGDNRSSNATVTHTSWNPRDPSLLATAGEALCRIWTLPHHNHHHTHYHDLLDAAAQHVVTSMAWSPDGEYIAIATRTHAASLGRQGTVTIRTKTGELQDELPATHDWVLNLSWNPSGSLLLGVTHSDDNDTTLVVWDVKNGQPMQPFELDKAVMDAAWIDEHKFVVCGPNLIAESLIELGNIVALQRRAEAEVDQEWTSVSYDPITRTTAISTEETAMLAIVDSSKRLHCTKAHDADITGLLYQPLANPAAHSELAPRLLATSSCDGVIKIWDAKKPFTITHSLNLGRSAPAMAISFTSDGYLVAAASWNKVLIWSAEAGGTPKATWQGKEGEWLIDNVDAVNGNGEPATEEEAPATHSLSWDADGGKLAYGLRNQVCFILLP